jgi:tetratricopeptide (TPR) repeat protein
MNTITKKYTFMSLKISLWAGVIGLATTISLIQTAVAAKGAVEVSTTTGSLAEPQLGKIARVRRQGSSGDYFTSAMQKYKQGNYQGALADYNRAIRINPRNANAYYNRGLLKAAQLQDNDGALADYNRAIQLKSGYDAAYNNRGNLKMSKLKDYSGALADYNRAIQLKPNNVDAYYNRGVLKHTFLNDLVGGIADLKQATRLSQKQGNTQSYQAASDLLSQWQQPNGN